MQGGSKHCLNCGHIISGHFCSECGQRTNIHRIDFKNLVHDLFHALTHLDKGFLFTAKELIIRPGHTIREYIQGKRAHHPNPFLMLLIIGGICSYIYYRYQLKLIISYKIEELDENSHIIESKFFAILYIVYGLILALVDYTIFRYKKYNYTEFFTFNIFLSIEILLFQLLLVPIWLLGRAHHINDWLRLVVFFIYYCYMLFARFQFFEMRSDAEAKKKLILEAFILALLFCLFGWKTIDHLIH